jgi:putative restriction endonuclease
MKFWLATTDFRWFQFLSERSFDEVNFWQPSTKPPFVNAEQGMPFLFKLKRPHNHIGGGGFFVRHSAIPLSLAWEIFGEQNGAASLTELRALLGPLASHHVSLQEIGCQVIANPFFLEAGEWFPDPPGWAPNIVRGKMYDTSYRDGEAIWSYIGKWFSGSRTGMEEAEGTRLEIGVGEDRRRYASETLVRPRIGQGAFRLALTDVYKRRCAITGERTLPVLEAAHIVPYAEKGTHEIPNGLLLRADFHKLFDVGLVSISPDRKIHVSPRIREMWFNGKAYYRLENQPMAVIPEDPLHRPDPDRLNWHFKNVFQG